MTQLLLANIDGVAPEKDDPLRILLNELGAINTPTEPLTEDGFAILSHFKIDFSQKFIRNYFEFDQQI